MQISYSVEQTVALFIGLSLRWCPNASPVIPKITRKVKQTKWRANIIIAVSRKGGKKKKKARLPPQNYHRA